MTVEAPRLELSVSWCEVGSEVSSLSRVPSFLVEIFDVICVDDAVDEEFDENGWTKRKVDLTLRTAVSATVRDIRTISVMVPRIRRTAGRVSHILLYKFSPSWRRHL